MLVGGLADGLIAAQMGSFLGVEGDLRRIDVNETLMALSGAECLPALEVRPG